MARPVRVLLRGRPEAKQNIGFTLIELLVVIAVIAALGAILYPLLAQAKDSAKMKTCAANLRQMGAAFRMYVDDYDGYALPLPPVPYSDPWVVYVKPLLPYLGQRRVALYVPQTVRIQQIATGTAQLKRPWICPGDVGAKGTGPVWESAGASYMYPGPGGYVEVEPSSDLWDSKTWPQRALGTRRVDQWARPQRDMLFADYWNYFHRGLAPSADPRSGQRANDSAHGARSVNVIMLDLHVITAFGDEITEPDGTFGRYLRYVLHYDNRYSKFYNPWFDATGGKGF